MQVLHLKNLFLCCCLAGPFLLPAQTATPSVAMAKEWVDRSHTLAFVENKGQLSNTENEPVPFVFYKASAPGLDIYLTNKGLTYVMLEITEESGHRKKHQEEKLTVRWARTDVQLAGADIRKENTIAEYPDETAYNFYYAHCPQGIRNVMQYKKITVKNVYPGIDWVLYTHPSVQSAGGNGTLKYEFIVHPGADPSQIKMKYEGAKKIALDKEGRLFFSTKYGHLTEEAPVSIQHNKRIATNFFLHNNEVSFRTGSYDKSQPLVIDPPLVWTTFYGGNQVDGFESIDCDAAGNLFVVGYSASSNFPTLNAGSYYDGTYNGGASQSDGFVLKFSNTGTLLWGTYVGGTAGDLLVSCTVDAAGNLYASGNTGSSNFPTQNGGGYYDASFNGSADAVFLKFSNTGNMLWSTYYGGSDNDRGAFITRDASGNIYITGETYSTNFPVQSAGGYFVSTKAGTTQDDAILLKFDASLNLTWATYLGGSSFDSGSGIAIDAAGNIYAGGTSMSTDFPVLNGGGFYAGTSGGSGDIYLTKFDAATNMVRSTYLGGNGNESGTNLTIDNANNLYLAGYSFSTNFPVVNPSGGAYFDNTKAGTTSTSDMVIMKFDNAGNIIWSTYYGGSMNENTGTNDNILLDACGNLYVSFQSESPDITTLDPGNGVFFDGSFGGTASDIFLTKFTTSGVSLWATYLGGSNGEQDFRSPLALDPFGALYLGGEWITSTSTGYPLVNPAGGAYYDNTPNGSDDSFIAKFKFLPLKLDTLSSPSGCSCNGSATVSVTGGAPPYHYNWQGGSPDTAVLSALCPGNYTVTVTDVNCNKDTAVIIVKSGGSGGLSLTISKTDPTCNNTNGSATVVTTSGTLPYSYSWTGTAQTGQTASNLGAGTYTVTVTDQNNCSATLSVTLSIASGLNACFTPMPSQTDINNPEIYFTDCSTGAVQWFWRFGDKDSSTSTASNPAFTYRDTGTFCITLKIQDAGGCMDTTTNCIQIQGDYTFYVPNAFTPNGDGKNDVFMPQGTGINTFELYVFDRWGNQIFHSKDILKYWDGKVDNGKSGKSIEEDVYVWILDITDINDKKHHLAGHVTVIK